MIGVAVRLALLALAVTTGATAQAADDCLSQVTPENLIRRQFGDVSREGLYDYATCTELIGKGPSLCGYFPGGPRHLASTSRRFKRYTVVGADAKVRYDFEYAVCDSRSAGYLLLAGLVAGEPRADLLPYARRMLNGERALTAAQLLDVSSAVYHGGASADPRLAKFVDAGFFNYLRGPESCADVKLEKLRRECEWKAAAVAALRAHDQSLCARGDLMCRALFEGERACREVGREAIRLFCEQDAPKLRPPVDDWRFLRASM